MKNQQQRYRLPGILIAFLLIPCLAFAKDRPYGGVVVFGDSLSDPGNAFILSGVHLTPPYETLDQFLIPDAPYARGGNHFSNGATWIEQLARKLDLGDSVKPAFKGDDEETLKHGNYAVGGARTRDDGINVNLNVQLGAFLADSQGPPRMDTLYVIALGGNDVRDAVAAFSLDPTGQTSTAILQDALQALADSILVLHGVGAKNLLIANSPDLSLTPAIQRLDSLFPGMALAAAMASQQFNMNLAALLDELSLAFPGLEIMRLDLSQVLHRVVADPDAYGLSNVTDPCVMPNQPPYACKKPKRFLFWDGIHPTRAAHGIIAAEAVQALDLAEDGNEVSVEEHLKEKSRKTGHK